MNKIFGYIIGIIFLTIAINSVASPINSGFEMGDFTGWTTDNPVGFSEFPPQERLAGSLNILSSGWHGRNPNEGSHMLAVSTGEYAYFQTNLTYNIFASQPVTLYAGDTIQGSAFFYNGDYEAQDSAWVHIFDGSGTNLLASPWIEHSGNYELGSLRSVPYQGATPWTIWNWTAPTDGTYMLSLGVTTFGDDAFASAGVFDAINVVSTATVPEPMPVAIFLTAAAFLIRRRK